MPAELNGPLWPLLLRAAGTLLKPVRLTVATLSRQHLLINPLRQNADLAQYQHLLGYATDRLPLCWFYPLLQKAQLASMLDLPGLPIVGLVHLRNRLQRPAGHAPAAWSTDLLAQSTRWRIDSQLSLSQSDHWLLAAQQQLYIDDQLWLTAESCYLVKKSPNSQPRPVLPAISSGRLLQQWPTDAALARRYAALSGDWNPIHLWDWSARLLGQRQAILHGMASAALLEARLPQPVSGLQLAFVKTIRPGLPLELRQGKPDEFWLCQQDRLCLHATLD
jgi:hypothetical protein